MEKNLREIDWKNVCETLVRTFLKISIEKKEGNTKAVMLAEDIFHKELLRAANDLQIDFKKNKSS